MKTLTIKWQRLIDEMGGTCGRCGATEKEVEKASRVLEQLVSPLGLKVVVEKIQLNYGTFRTNPLASNRIWINDRPVEEWLEAQVGQSPCCTGPCHGEECRTIVIEGKCHEVISADMIIKAGLSAASEMTETGPQRSCRCSLKE